MAADNSLQKLLDQLSSVLHMAETASKSTLKGPLPPGAKEQLKLIQDMAEVFTALNIEALKNAGVTEDEIQNPKMADASSENSVERRLLNNSTQLAKDAKSGYDDLTFAIKQLKNEKAAPKTRKKKFDRLGSRDKWKPL